MTPINKHRIAVIGLGYVGLPLAVALARQFTTIGFDINENRLNELRTGRDMTGEIDADRLKGSTLTYSSCSSDLLECDVFIVTVPTPVDDANLPDLSALLSASRTVGTALQAGKRQIVVYESTVYPGVTEDICGRELEKISGLKCGLDFYLGYSPERINPGDREHSVDKIIKVVAGQTPEILNILAGIYGSITTGGVFRATSIKVAEAAKVIENAQRDINIAFMNEIAIIFQRTGISVHDVLDAAATKWNFLRFSPGLVGGHCIGVDPYYLSHLAQKQGHHPEVILAGRRINDTMGCFVADKIHSRLSGNKRILVLGITFKEDVPDLRNSKAADVIRRLKWLGHDVIIHDPHADAQEAMREYGLPLNTSALQNQYDTVVLAVAHADYRNLAPHQIEALLIPGGLAADIKGAWRHLELGDGYQRWQL